MATFVVSLLLATLSQLPLLIISQSTPPLLPQIHAQTLCSDPKTQNPFACELHEAKLKLARLETVLEEKIQSLNSKVVHLQEREKLIEEMEVRIHHLQASLLSIKRDSLSADKRIDALEEEVRLLWDASRKNNFELYSLELKAEEAEERLEALTIKVGKMSDIVTEQWIQIQQLEQALQIAEVRALKAERLVGFTRCTFLKFIDDLYRNYIWKTFKVLDHHLFTEGSTMSSYMSQALHRIRIILSAAKQYHHELQGFIKRKMEMNELTAALANEEIVFFVASAVITFPFMGAWALLLSQFS